MYSTFNSSCLTYLQPIRPKSLTIEYIMLLKRLIRSIELEFLIPLSKILDSPEVVGDAQRTLVLKARDGLFDPWVYTEPHLWLIESLLHKCPLISAHLKLCTLLDNCCTVYILHRLSVSLSVFLLLTLFLTEWQWYREGLRLLTGFGSWGEARCRLRTGEKVRSTALHLKITDNNF